MDYGKITTDKRIQKQGNPVSVTIANPTETQKAAMASLRGEVPLVYTTQPTYDPETQYVTDYWEEESGQAVQHWEIHELPTPEPTLEDRVENLEDGLDALTGVAE